ncbi:MAG: CotH kinase family protein [Acidobacteria bacterium]|nr:CotH kinase family protein [Acidobacteriota bacterium]
MCRAKRFLLAFTLLAMSAVGNAHTADELFDDTIIHEIRLYLHPYDWGQLRANFLGNTYYPAEIHWRGLQVANVAVRSRGLGSRSGTKPSLKVEFDRYVKTQQFLGLTSLILNNSIEDASFLRARLSMLLFREMGIPAPRQTYARLYVNDLYAGLYLMVEPVDKVFLARNFRENEGHLYEYRWRDSYYFEYLGLAPGLYSPRFFEPRTREEDFDPATIVELIRVINFSTDGGELQQFLDIEMFLRFLAVENFLAEWDGILGQWGMNNFYLYRFQGTRRFEFIPWDREFSFKDPFHPISFNADMNVLTKRLLGIPELYSTYLHALRATAIQAGGTGEWLAEELERAYAQMRFAALEDPLKPVSNAEFENEVEAIRDFVRQRRDYVISQVGPVSPE